MGAAIAGVFAGALTAFLISLAVVRARAWRNEREAVPRKNLVRPRLELSGAVVGGLVAAVASRWLEPAVAVAVGAAAPLLLSFLIVSAALAVTHIRERQP